MKQPPLWYNTSNLDRQTKRFKLGHILHKTSEFFCSVLKWQILIVVKPQLFQYFNIHNDPFSPAILKFSSVKKTWLTLVIRRVIIMCIFFMLGRVYERF